MFNIYITLVLPATAPGAVAAAAPREVAATSPGAVAAAAPREAAAKNPE